MGLPTLFHGGETVAEQLLLGAQLKSQLLAAADLGFNQEVEVFVVEHGRNCIRFAKKPGVVAQIQTRARVVARARVRGHALLQLVGELVLPLKHLEVKAREGKPKGLRFELVLERDKLSSCHALGGVPLQTLVDQL